MQSDVVPDITASTKWQLKALIRSAYISLYLVGILAVGSSANVPAWINVVFFLFFTTVFTCMFPIVPASALRRRTKIVLFGFTILVHSLISIANYTNAVHVHNGDEMAGWMALLLQFWIIDLPVLPIVAPFAFLVQACGLGSNSFAWGAVFILVAGSAWGVLAVWIVSALDRAWTRMSEGA